QRAGGQLLRRAEVRRGPRPAGRGRQQQGDPDAAGGQPGDRRGRRHRRDREGHLRQGRQESMMAYLQHLSFWDWLAFGTVLLILEVFGAGGYLLWIGVAAAVVGVLTYLFPELPWAWQFL